MDVDYFRALASRCRASGRNCTDPYSKEEFRRLADEFDLRAYKLGRPQEIEASSVGTGLRLDHRVGPEGDL
jgi:hypothetical protein